ncbi:hypothetical protein [Leuconostoc mesenteroides]|uniref:hypothetical protein n=1 Tax=Leuconostoc mesenteroides TaxID=1245 RepID=UPI0012397D59|nr:hypothetical protein [Leuconostoc mesenteroides]KAA8366079.1 hypothetical protein FE417_08185 [Leuconostoc mesenteroides]
MSVLMLLINPLLGVFTAIQSFSKNYSSKWKVIIITAITFFFLGYSIQLINMNADLARYFLWFPNYEDVSYNELISNAISTKNIFVIQQIMLAFFGQLQNNKIFTGFISALFYSCYMYIITTFLSQVSWKNHSIIKKEIVIFFGIMLFSFGWVLTSVRNPMANALIAVAIFKDLYLHQKNFSTFLFYFLGISMHVAVIPIIICRVVVGIFVSQPLRRRFFSAILAFLFAFIALRSNILSEASGKIDTYGIGSTGGGFAQYARSSIYYQVNGLFLLLLMFLTLTLLFIIKSKKVMIDTTFCNFMFVVTILAILSYFMPTPLIDRYGMFVELFIPLLIVCVPFNQLTKNTRLLYTTAFLSTGAFGTIWQILFLSYQIDISSFFLNILKGWAFLFT